MGRGEFFGEMKLVDGGPRSAIVEAATDMRLLVVGRREFWQSLTAAPSLVLKIMSTLSRRVRDAESCLRHDAESRPSSEPDAPPRVNPPARREP